jgi:hypothetical protein
MFGLVAFWVTSVVVKARMNSFSFGWLGGIIFDIFNNSSSTGLLVALQVPVQW